jgi:rubrerythrin
VSYWLLCAVTAVLPLQQAHAWRRVRLRTKRCLCPQCGYDLRATPERCPECGAVARKVVIS